MQAMSSSAGNQFLQHSLIHMYRCQSYIGESIVAGEARANECKIRRQWLFQRALEL